MRIVRHIAACCAILAFSSAAWGLGVPLPGVGDMTIAANDAYAEIFIQNTTDQDIPIPNPADPAGPPLAVIPANTTINNVAVGYTLSDPTGKPNMVLYTGASTTQMTLNADGTQTITPPGPQGAYQSPHPYQVLAYDAVLDDGGTPNNPADDQRLISNLLGGKIPGLEGRLFVVGRVLAIRDSGAAEGSGFLYSRGPSDPNPNPQLTFTVYNAYINGMTMSDPPVSPVQGGTITTSYEIGDIDPSKQMHVDFYADPTPDAQIGVTNLPGIRYAPVDSDPVAFGNQSDDTRPELPVRGPVADGAGGDTPGGLYVDLDNGTYYDRSTGKVWGDMAFAGDPLDLDEEVMWSFVGNVNENNDPEKVATMMLDTRFTIPALDAGGNPISEAESFVVQQTVQATGLMTNPQFTGTELPNSTDPRDHPQIQPILRNSQTGDIIWITENNGIPYWLPGGTGIPMVIPGFPDDQVPLYNPDGSPMLTTKDVEVFVSGASNLLPEVSLVGVLQAGPSLSPKAEKNPYVWYDKTAWDAGDEKAGYLNHYLIKGADYSISGSFLFGGKNTGAYDSDPDTFSFQEIPLGTVNLLQLSGPLAPEPITALSVLLAASGLGGYIRRRRRKA